VTASVPEFLGMLIACAAAAAALLARDPRLRYGAAAVALIAAPALVAGNVWDTPRFVDLRHHHAQIVVGIVVVAITVGGAAAVFRRFPWTFAISLFATLPLRVPIRLGGQTSHLLVPLYGVIAAGVLCFGYAAFVGLRANGDGDRPADGHLSARLGDWPAAVWLCRALAATLLLYAIQTFYSDDVSNAIENACFFLVPFAVMFVLLGEVRWTQRLLGGILIAVAAMGLVFAGVAFWEYAARDLLLSRGDLLQANQLHIYFRVNSLFYDPNVLGRYLALTLVALGAYLAWSRGVRMPIVAALVSGILLAALALTYSITSFIALVAGLLVVAALRWSVRWALAGGAAIVLCGAIFLAVAGTAHTDLGSTKSLNTASSGRVDLVNGAVKLARRRPVWGWGSGSFGAAFNHHIQRASSVVSHSEPLTVAAEQGAIGLVVYAAVVVLALIVLLTGAGASVGTAATAACFVALIAHSLGYAGFAIDPATWALLGLGIGLRAPRLGARAYEAAAREEGPSATATSPPTAAPATRRL
jgi:putative inorganic carbon (hco3(-)) transporter